MRYLLLISAALLFVGLAGVGPCTAQSGPGAMAAGPGVGDIVMDAAARRILHDYYARNAEAWVIANPDQAGGNKKQKNNKRKKLPPGIARQGSFPPGPAKQLVRNGHLPPGLEFRDLPPDLIVQLPPLGPDYRYVIADDRVMLIRAATNVILDILQVPAL